MKYRTDMLDKLKHHDVNRFISNILLDHILSLINNNTGKPKY